MTDRRLPVADRQSPMAERRSPTPPDRNPECVLLLPHGPVGDRRSKSGFSSEFFTQKNFDFFAFFSFFLRFVDQNTVKQ